MTQSEDKTKQEAEKQPAEAAKKDQAAAKPQQRKLSPEEAERAQILAAVDSAYAFLNKIKPGIELLERLQKHGAIDKHEFKHAVGYGILPMRQMGLFTAPQMPKPPAAKPPVAKTPAAKANGAEPQKEKPDMKVI